ncbi:hypothetical protein RKE38_06640 [Phycicoccus sp. M110.8]|uniref:hypothetical protein n=1 Tax=Phycicoccus sp. M110.8 TaxID=3075433 RepID=UPI0028FD9CE0|nr:hypothetical protein [Phycicoccus sp. M110.8]MDU0313361.1 hypothetical protein [Phycicoccus sp. M110.8]HET8767042.1 hypothetical protein [Pedococcus sp.]
MTTDPDAGGDLTDDALQDEIELVGDLVVAASASERPLTDEEIDRALGLVRGHRSAPEGGPAAPHRSSARLHV